MALTKIDVLCDVKNGDLSLIAVDDTDGCSVETTLSVEEAWILVTQINSAIQKLSQAKTPQAANINSVNIDALGTTNPAQVEAAVCAAIRQSAPNIERRPERVKEAVLEAIGADQVRKERYSKPGFPATVSKSGLREYVEPTQ